MHWQPPPGRDGKLAQTLYPGYPGRVHIERQVVIATSPLFKKYGVMQVARGVEPSSAPYVETLPGFSLQYVPTIDITRNGGGACWKLASVAMWGGITWAAPTAGR